MDAILKTVFLALILLLGPQDPAQASDNLQLPSIAMSDLDVEVRRKVYPELKMAVTLPFGWVQKSGPYPAGVGLIVQHKERRRAANCQFGVRIENVFRSFDNDKILNETFPNNNPDEYFKKYRLAGIDPVLIHSGRVFVSGERAILIDFHVDVEHQGMSERMRVLVVQFIKGDGLYTITCTDVFDDFERSIPEFGLIINNYRALQN